MLKLMARFIPSINNISHIRGEYERRSIPFKIAKHLGISEEFPKVDVKDVARRFHHNIVIVSITNAENVGGN